MLWAFAVKDIALYLGPYVVYNIQGDEEEEEEEDGGKKMYEGKRNKSSFFPPSFCFFFFVPLFPMVLAPYRSFGGHFL